MTDTVPKPRSAHGYWLRTFGALALETLGDETVLGKHRHQRRRLALLAVLAAAGEHGRTRDQLLLLFWPDATQTRARHSLEQLLYAIRSSIDDAVFAGTNPVRLNPDLIRSDVGEFQTALGRGDYETAVHQYKGVFLDGVYLTDTPEFEQWLEAERAQIHRSYSGALEKLARAAESSSDHAMAVHWWQKLADADPVGSAGAIGLMTALMNAGDHPAALQYAERYERTVAQELGTTVGSAVASVVAEIRSATGERPLPEAEPRGRLSRIVPETVSPPVSAPIAITAPARGSPAGRWRYLSAVAVVATIAAAVTFNSMRHENSPAAAKRHSIAVLPFTNVSGDAKDAPLVDGLSEEMIGMLARMPDLRVISPTTAFTFRNNSRAPDQIADSLRVTNVLEGSVQRYGSHLRVQVRLIDAGASSAVWSETYDRELSDIFAVQREIAGAVARELGLRLGARALDRIQHGSTRNVAAYEFYLKGIDPTLLRSDSAANVGLEYLRHAIALDSSFAAAHAAFARMRIRSPLSGNTEIPLRERKIIAEKAALKAVALDDSLGDAHATLGLYRKQTSDIASAETELRRAVALEPNNPRYREWLGQIYIIEDRPAEALAEARRAVELDPLSATANAELAHALLASDRCDEALAQLQKVKLLKPPLLRASAIAAECYARKKMWPQAIAELRRDSANGGSRTLAHLGYTLARAGQQAEARTILADLKDRTRRTGGGAFEVAVVYAGLGDNDQTFAWLNRSIADGSGSLEFLTTVADGLRSDPRYDRFRRNLSLQQR